MKWIVVGLGNTGSDYIGTRHNVGRDMLAALEAKMPSHTNILLPNTYMNESGKAIRKRVASKKAAERLIVIHDDLDLPLGKIKLSFGSGAGGHKGVASIQSALKTKDFVRIRVGISPATSSGKIQKPDSKKVVDFVLGKFRAAELEKLKKVRKTVLEAITLLVSDGREAAMTKIHSR